jgi:hypothetical protein
LSLSQIRAPLIAKRQCRFKACTTAQNRAKY